RSDPDVSLDPVTHRILDGNLQLLNLQLLEYGDMRKAPDHVVRGLAGGRYWDRTSDLFRVREARYRCANRPSRLRGGYGIRTRVYGFAGRCLASRPTHHARVLWAESPRERCFRADDGT